MRPLAVLALASFVTPAFGSNTWYVDVHATPPGLGTLASPYASIQYAHDQAATVHGDELLVAPGVYVGDLTVTKHIQIRSTGGPLVTELRPAHSIGLFNLNGTPFSDELLLEGFTVFGLANWSEQQTINLNDSTLRRCVVRDNTHSTGVKVNLEGWIYDSVITNNFTGVSIGGFDVAMHVMDSVIWGNVHQDTSDPFQDGITYCAGLATNGHFVTGPGNVFADPKLWDIVGGDYRPRPGSPCIDAGNPTSPLDADGSRHDIGLFPYDPTYAPAPTTYCTAKVNSQGCSPSIYATGTASATSASAFTIGATNELNKKSGLLFYGYASKPIAFQGGFHCVKLPTKRTALQNAGGSPTGTDCTGTYAYDFRARIQSGVDAGLVPGTLVYAQYWSRDINDPFLSALSDAIGFGIAP